MAGSYQVNNSEEVLLLCHSHREASCNWTIVGFPVVTSQNVTQEVSNVGQKMFCRPTSARWILSVRSAGLEFFFFTIEYIVYKTRPCCFPLVSTFCSTKLLARPSQQLHRHEGSGANPPFQFEQRRKRPRSHTPPWGKRKVRLGAFEKLFCKRSWANLDFRDATSGTSPVLLHFQKGWNHFFRPRCRRRRALWLDQFPLAPTWLWLSYYTFISVLSYTHKCQNKSKSESDQKKVRVS